MTTPTVDVRCPTCSATVVYRADRGDYLVCPRPCGAPLNDAFDTALDALVLEMLEGVLMLTSSQPEPHQIPRLARALSEAVGVPCVVGYSPFRVEPNLLGSLDPERNRLREAPRYLLVAYAVPIVRSGGGAP